MKPRHIIVPLLLAALAFAIGQVVPGLGMFVVLGGSFIWIGLEQRRAGLTRPVARKNFTKNAQRRSDQ